MDQMRGLEWRNINKDIQGPTRILWMNIGRGEYLKEEDGLGEERGREGRDCKEDWDEEGEEYSIIIRII